jgi:hypothetical protein
MTQTPRTFWLPLLMALPVRADITPLPAAVTSFHLAASCGAPRRPPVPFRNTPCSEHRLPMCPVCQADEYMQRRVVKAVGRGLKRLGLSKSQPMLTYLGADSWQQVLQFLEEKRLRWNLAHPRAHMTLTNTALDHIRPVHAFSRAGHGAKTLLCNHYTNLQPLLHEDNAWKGDHWSAEDERFWHEHIILRRDYTAVFYPTSAPAQPSLLSARAQPEEPSEQCCRSHDREHAPRKN